MVRGSQRKWQLVRINLDAELAQPIENWPDRASGSWLVAHELGRSRHQGGHDRKKPHDGTGQSTLDRTGWTSQTWHDPNGGWADRLDVRAEALQTGRHKKGISGGQNAVKDAGPVTESCEDKGTVRLGL